MYHCIFKPVSYLSLNKLLYMTNVGDVHKHTGY